MKNKVFTASLGLVLLFALSFAGCKHDSDASPFDGTWKRSDGGYTMVMSGNNWVSFLNGENNYKGTFTYDESMLTLNFTQGWNGSSWVSYSAAPQTATYNLSGNTLTFGGHIWTRQ